MHDLGKYSERFLARLRGEERGLDHWTPGAVLARKRYGTNGTAVSVAVLGHHIGMDHAGPGLTAELRSVLQNPPRNVTESDLSVLVERLRADGLTIPEELRGSVYRAGSPSVASMLDIRMLFSALVDADYVETEAHFDGTAAQPRRYRPDGPPLRAARALELLLDGAERVRRGGRAE